MKINEIIDKAIDEGNKMTEEGISAAIDMLEKELPNYPNHPRLCKELTINYINYAAKSTRKDYEGFKRRYECAKMSLSLSNENLTLEKMRTRVSWLQKMALMMALAAVNSENIEKMEAGLEAIRTARTYHQYNPNPYNENMINKNLPSGQAYICYWLAFEYMKPETENLPRASMLLTEAYRIRMNEIGEEIRFCDVNPDVDETKVILRVEKITEQKQKINDIYTKRTAPTRPVNTNTSINSNSSANEAIDSYLDEVFKKVAPNAYAQGNAYKSQQQNQQNGTGANNQVRFCANCGKPVNPGDRFCGSCGGATDGSTPPPSTGKKPFWKRNR